MAASDAENSFHGLTRIGGGMHLDAKAAKTREKRFEMVVKILEGAAAYFPGAGTEGERRRGGFERLFSHLAEARGGDVERLLKFRVGDGG